MKRLYLVILAVLVIGSVPLVRSALATDPPQITVNPVWRPGTQLTTLGSDIRYVDAEIYVTTSVQFWASQFNCTVNKKVLETYTVDTGNTDPGDDVPVVRWGPDWGELDTNFTQVIEIPATNTGKITFTAARHGDAPIGSYGYAYTFLLVTVRYRVQAQTQSPFSGDSPFTCKTAFLDRDGREVLKARYEKPDKLVVFSGYSIAGKVTYQGIGGKAGAGVNCVFDPGGTDHNYTTTTNNTGAFLLSDLRELGWSHCFFFGNLANLDNDLNTPDVHLAAQVWVNLIEHNSYTFLPIDLRGGNVSRTGGSDFVIDGADITLVTANWNQTVAAPYTAGDTNGDRKSDRADLTIVVSNLFQGEHIWSPHMILSLPRNWDVPMNSRIWVTRNRSYLITQFVPNTCPNNTCQDYWPAMSPDGTKLAFTRTTPNPDGPDHRIYILSTDGKGKATPVTPQAGSAEGWPEAFAASWSPDGSQIAFACSWDATYASNPDDYGMQFGQTDICVVDKNGRNFRNVSGGMAGNHAHIYPPAWLSDHELLYAGNEWNVTCPNTLFYVNLQTGERRLYDEDIPGVGDPGIADMPTVVGAWWEVLLYRYTNGTDRRVRYAQFVDPDNRAAGVDAWEARSDPPVAPFHIDVEYDQGGGTYVPISTDVDYYEVYYDSPFISFYETGGNEFIDAIYDQSFPLIPAWYAPEHYCQVDNMVGNPDPTPPTTLFMYRNTVDWVP